MSKKTKLNGRPSDKLHLLVSFQWLVEPLIFFLIMIIALVFAWCWFWGWIGLKIAIGIEN